VESTGTNGTFVTSAKTFTIDVECGGDDPGITEGSYTVSGKTLTLYIAGGNIELVLAKQ
jgi:hypothetical protein